MTVPRAVMIVGAGGHARVIESILALDPAVRIVGVADQSAGTAGELVGGSRIVATIDDRTAWRRLGATAVALAIGDNRRRADLFAALDAEGWELVSAVHPTAIVSARTTIGRGCAICAGAVLCTDVELGDNVLINTGALIDHEGRIGAHAHVGPGSVLAGRVRVGAFTFVGAGSTVRDGIRIGAGTVVGAGSVVVEDLPDDVVAFGVPARVRRPA